MKFNTWWLRIVIATIFETPALSQAFDIQLTPEHVKEAKESGTKYKGKDIFDSPMVKSACFGEYPKGEGGLIMSKYMRIAVNSAMKALKDETLSLQDIKEFEESNTFSVVVNVSSESVQTPEDVQIMLIQGTDTILPQKTEFSMKYKDKRQGVVGTFPYAKINPKANTTIIVKTRKDQKKYTIDFSDVK